MQKLERVFVYSHGRDPSRPLQAIVQGELRARPNGFGAARFETDKAHHCVVGQLHTVPAEKLALLDALNAPGFVRRRVTTFGGTDAWTYEYQGADFYALPAIPNGVWAPRA